MFDFHERRKIRSWLYSKTSIGILSVLLVLLGMSVFERLKIEREIRGKRIQTELELRALEERAAGIEAKVQHLNRERGVEEELRSRFDVAKEGEQVVIIVDDNASDGRLRERQAREEKESTQSWWEFLRFWQ